MKEFLKIENIQSLEILDSRGNPTIQVKFLLKMDLLEKHQYHLGHLLEVFEAVELRDGDKTRYLGKGVEKAVENVNKRYLKKIIGMNVFDQRRIDEEMVRLDDTPNKSNLGANAILGVSLAVAKAAAEALGIELYRYIGVEFMEINCLFL